MEEIWWVRKMVNESEVIDCCCRSASIFVSSPINNNINRQKIQIDNEQSSKLLPQITKISSNQLFDYTHLLLSSIYLRRQSTIPIHQSYSQWLLVIKNRVILPNPPDDPLDTRDEWNSLVDRLREMFDLPFNKEIRDYVLVSVIWNYYCK